MTWPFELMSMRVFLKGIEPSHSVSSVGLLFNSERSEVVFIFTSSSFMTSPIKTFPSLMPKMVSSEFLEMVRRSVPSNARLDWFCQLYYQYRLYHSDLKQQYYR